MKKQLQEEEIIVKKSNQKIKYGFYAICLIFGTVFAVPMMKKDPVQFWFVTIVIICSAAKVMTQKK